MNQLLRFLILFTGPLLVSCMAAPGFKGDNSSHFDGKLFYNKPPMNKTVGDLMRLGWGTLTQAADWPHWIEIEPQLIPSERVWSGVSVTYINHSTFLIQVDGVNILTDPVYSERVSPFTWVGPQRVHAPGVVLEDLPPIDVILISHNHYDHLDETTLRSLLSRQDEPPLLLAGLGNSELLATLGVSDQRDLDWEESAQLGGLEFTFTESRHRSGRGLSDQMKTLWGAFVVKTSKGNIYFAGDTGYSPHLAATGERHGPFALTLLPIGAYEPRWFMKDVHLNPDEAVRAHRELRSEFSIGIHFGAFQLTYEAIDQPLVDLSAALEEHKLPATEFTVLEPGETRNIASVLPGSGNTSR
ncbi:MAG: L-ascorbate metabolism protein UlaG (beta-lactamase superfamily), partial [Glaciecola sp.]|jgi:L-ascorbate metabolism protein UlaG (beta-lactamase superfamily)|uniref:MBL fold metallo-hydrolase n=1 Tax=Congregibacter sp. TaxID=2744308 RepID=UPI0039E240E4